MIPPVISMDLIYHGSDVSTASKSDWIQMLALCRTTDNVCPLHICAPRSWSTLQTPALPAHSEPCAHGDGRHSVGPTLAQRS